MVLLLSRLGVGRGGFGFGKKTQGGVSIQSSATGGDIDNLEPGNGYVYHTFTSTGPATFTVLSPSLTSVELFMIGGGGCAYSGGGGAGALIYRTSVPVSPGPYTVSVGAGGPNASLPANSPAPNGSPSTALGFTAAGGGGGGVQVNPYTTRNGNPGGSGGPGGGGAGGGYPGATPVNGSSGTANTGGGGGGAGSIPGGTVSSGGGGSGIVIIAYPTA